MDRDIFGNVITPDTPKQTRGKTKKPEVNKPKPLPARESVIITPAKIEEVQLGDINAKYDPGDRVEYLYPKMAGGYWEEGILLGFYDPRNPEKTGQCERFSFIEVEINGIIRKAFSLEQIRKVQ